MITHKILEERIILETSDFNKLGLSTYVKLGKDKDRVLLRSKEKEYFCRRKGLHEYEVLDVYLRAEERRIDLDAIRRSGI